MCVLSCFSHVQLFATLWTAACQPSLFHGILQAGILEWVAISFSRGSSHPRDWNCIFYVSCTGRQASLPLAPPGLNPGLPHCRQILYQLNHKGSPNPGIELGSHALQADSLPSELSGKPCISPAGLKLWRWELSEELVKNAEFLAPPPLRILKVWVQESVFLNWPDSRMWICWGSHIKKLPCILFL